MNGRLSVVSNLTRAVLLGHLNIDISLWRYINASQGMDIHGRPLKIVAIFLISLSSTVD